MGDGKWETNGVKVNHPTPRLGFDAFESRSTLADLSVQGVMCKPITQLRLKYASTADADPRSYRLLSCSL